MNNIKYYSDFIKESLDQSLFESIDWKGVKIVTARSHGGVFKDGPKKGQPKDLTGRLVLMYGGRETYYKLEVIVKKLLVTWYDGPIAVDAIWKNDKGEVYAKDNTDKVFKLDVATLNKIAAEAKKASPTIAFTGTGTIKGLEGTYDATLTKVA